jgi:hypothetical protein
MGSQNRQDLLELSRWRIARIGRRDIMSIAEGEMSRAQLAACPMKFRLAVTKWAAVDSNHVPPHQPALSLTDATEPTPGFELGTFYLPRNASTNRRVREFRCTTSQSAL